MNNGRGIDILSNRYSFGSNTQDHSLQDIGIGNSVNDLIRAVAANSSAVSLRGNILADIEIADGTEFDGDDNQELFTISMTDNVELYDIR